MRIIVKQFFVVLLMSFIVTVFHSPVLAVTVTNISVSPVNPAYGQEFYCTINVDVDNHDVSCGLVPTNAPTSTIPWDICPKKNGLGRQDNDTRTTIVYKCIADTSTHVAGPGNYQLVAWHFWNDGAAGEAIASLPVTITAYRPPTATPIPTQPSPTPVPTLYVLPTEILPPTGQPNQSGLPTITLPNSAVFIPTIRPTTNPQSATSVDTYIMDSLKIGSAFFVGRTMEIGNAVVNDTKSLFSRILESFFRETAF